jgi:hypothetical protein
MMREMMLRVLMPAGEIPVGATVTKRTGEKPYILRDKITIYTEPKQEIKAGDQARFLVGDNGDVNVVAMVTELLWTVSESQLSEFLEGTPQ